jgi:copper homeostasis protein
VTGLLLCRGGINSGNIETLMKATGASEFHGSARKQVENPMKFTNPAVSDYGNVYHADEEEVRKIVSILNNTN